MKTRAWLLGFLMLVLPSLALAVTATAKGETSAGDLEWKVNLVAEAGGTSLVLQGTLTNLTTSEVLAAPSVRFAVGETAEVSTEADSYAVEVRAFPADDEGRIAVELKYTEGSELVFAPRLILEP